MTVGTEEPFPSCLALPNVSLGISSLFWEESSLGNSFTTKKFSSWRTVSQVGKHREGITAHPGGGQGCWWKLSIFQVKEIRCFQIAVFPHENK